MSAQNADFFTGDTIDPFAGLAPAEDPSTQEAARRAQLQQSATATANINNAPGGYMSDRTIVDPGGTVTDEEHAASDEYMRQHHLGKYARSLGYNLSRDPVTMAVLAAPYGAVGAGAALGGAAGLGFGEGAGTLVGSSVPGITTGGATELASIAAPTAAGATSAVPAAAGAAAAASPWATTPLGTVAGYAGKGLVAAAPLLINEALGGRTKEEKALVAKQEQLAQEAQVRQGQQQDARMNQLGQQLLAFNPTNQLMAQMFGPQAAFTPEQMATMVQGQAPAYDESLTNYKGNDPKIQAKVEEYLRRKAEYDQSEASRRNMMLSGTTPVGPAQPGIQMGAPQAARRY